MKIYAYLNFNGQCEEAFKFYEKALGGKIETMLAHAGAPVETHVPAEWRSKILHARLAVGDQVLMGSDIAPGEFAQPKGFAVSLHFKSPEETEKVFAALSEGGKIQMPVQKTFWSRSFGMLVDKFGIPWLVNCE